MDVDTRQTSFDKMIVLFCSPRSQMRRITLHGVQLSSSHTEKTGFIQEIVFIEQMPTLYIVRPSITDNIQVYDYRRSDRDRDVK
jgi:ABC-type transport system involved in cytochrome bd biosynthesis fused ATPase/permease subunit